MNHDPTNEIFRIAAELVIQSSRHVFLTGKAGTGKTTFLKYIRERCPKQMAVVAPTGVAAINAGGVTIHSFFQLPLSLFIPEIKGFSSNREAVVNPHSLISRLRITKEKIRVLQQLELLIIDEISMVRCDIMDAIDTVLRHVRKKPYERFGGVQLLMIGDMFQLPPVIKEQDWNILSEFYKSPYFFDSAVIREEPPMYIEFDKIYRQNEERFIRVLNQVRNNELDGEGLMILQSRYQPHFKRKADDGYIILTSHNEIARNTNADQLDKLDTRSFVYRAEIEGDFPDTAYPAEEVLLLKEGAQVMFIKNDSDRSKRFYNGKIGIVTGLEEDKILVKCKGETDEIEVNKERWENIRYTLNRSNRQMEESVLGSFSQYPLRLAWAITIHKSQGLTFEKAIIDAGRSFAAGQVYVALSRCTNLEGMVLQSEIQTRNLFTDQRIVKFSKNSTPSAKLNGELATARQSYQEKLLLLMFDFRPAVDNANEVSKYVAANVSSFNAQAVMWTTDLFQRINLLQEMAEKFHVWLKGQFQLPVSLEENPLLLERTMRAAEHFVKELGSVIDHMQRAPVVSDSKPHAKEFNDWLKEVFAELSAKKHLLDGYNGSLDAESWHRRNKSFVLPPFMVNAYAAVSQQRTDVPYPELYQQLRKLRDSICASRDTPIYMVAGSNTLDEMTRYLPQSLSELRKISGFGDAKASRYGQGFLEIILEYSKANNLLSRIHEKPPKKERKSDTDSRKGKVDTKAESLRLYKEGNSVDIIAKKRSLTVQTIEGHLAYYISRGEINIEELVSRDKLILIESAIKKYNGGSITSIKESLGNDIGFGEIRLAIAWKKYQNGLSA
ncbi:MAG: helix-turn-helix domain-containing protein [Chitinophagaceae bacterium]|nr:helix-turn-helix domain-containing protein [Chitinophagaceae bacterium]